MSRSKDPHLVKEPRKRADVLLVERNLAPTRSQAQALLLAGKVFSGEQRIDKGGTLLAPNVPLELREGNRFVSRGGDKLAGALERLDVNVEGLICADIGASTGGFTDCLLQNGAERVHAVDVGHGLIADKLRRDPRVHVLERTNARYLTRDDLGESVDCVVVDASFIGIDKLLPAIFGILKDEGLLVAMIKPQFEAGRAEVARGRGVIRDPEVRAQTLRAAEGAIVDAGFELGSGCDSVLAGPKGNLEYFVRARKLAAQSTSTQRS